MSSNIVPPATFDSTQVTFRAPKILDSGGKMVYLDYEGRPLLTQTASMSLPYGLNTFDKAGPTTYSVDLSFRGMETDPKVKHFYDMMVAFDEALIEAGIKNSQAWFKMPNASREVIKAFYTPSVKVSLDKDGKPKPYPPTFKVKLPKKNGTFTTSFYDAEKRPYEGVSVEELMVKGSRGVFLVKCTGLWFAGSKYGATWKAEQVKLDSVPQNGLGRGCAILDDDDAPAVRRQTARAPVAQDDEDEDDVVEAVMPSSRSAPQATEEDEDEEEEDVVEAPPPPRRVVASTAPAGAKKVVKRTTK